MTIKEQLIREIEQAPEASLIKFMQIWQFAKQSGFTAISSEDWEQHQETLFVLQNDDLMKQISRSMETHEQRNRNNLTSTNLSNFFHQSPLAEFTANNGLRENKANPKSKEFQ
jgi:hypothetical protein